MIDFRLSFIEYNTFRVCIFPFFIFLNHALNMYDLATNPARKVKNMGKEKSKNTDFWTKEEFQKFLDVIADQVLSYYAFEILYWCGIREGELLALTKKILILKERRLPLINHISG